MKKRCARGSKCLRNVVQSTGAAPTVAVGDGRRKTVPWRTRQRKTAVKTPTTHGMVVRLFELQVDLGLRLSLRWLLTADNQ